MTRHAPLPIADPTLTDPCECGCIEGFHLICGCAGCGHPHAFTRALPVCQHCGQKVADLDAHMADRPAECQRAERRRARGYETAIPR